MRFLTSSVEAQLHRESYVALLNSVLRSPGAKHALAQRAHISDPYLSYILKLDRDSPGYVISRTPSLKVAQRIVQSLDVPVEIRQSLLEHMTLAHEKRVQAQQGALIEVPQRPLHEVASEINTLREQAIYTSSVTLASSYYRSAVETAKLVLRCIPFGTSPLDYASLCDIITDCQLVLNRADDALWHAKVASAVLENADPMRPHDEQDRFDFVAVNTIRQQGVAYYNLGLYREALRQYAFTEVMEPMKRRGTAWIGLVSRDKIKALSRLPRFSITEVENIADQMRTALEGMDDVNGHLGLWLLTEALADAYIRHANYKDARRILEQVHARSNKIPIIGPLPRVLFLRRYAALSRNTRDTSSWRHFIRDAYQIAREAGLSHQRVEIEAEMREQQTWLTDPEDLTSPE